MTPVQKNILVGAAIVAALAEAAVIYVQWPAPPVKICASVELGELLAKSARAEAELRATRGRLRTDPDEALTKQIMLLETASAAANNGSAFGGISVNTKWYNTTLGLVMIFGRFFMIIPPLAIAGSLSRKKLIPPSLGTFPVTTPLFSVLLVGVIVIVGALTFFPVLSLGPIVEHFLLNNGQVF